MGGRPKNTPDVLWSKVDKRGPDDCWEWTGWKTHWGYGRTQIAGKTYCAHRVMFDLVNPGVITLEAPKDRTGPGFLLHSCDNPACCNPAHLSVGTIKDNMEDMMAKGRHHDYRAAWDKRRQKQMEVA